MKISAIAPWFGSKRTLAPRIVRELGDHSSFWDVFCGSLAVTLAKPVSSSETVNDLHGDLINLAIVCKHEDLARELWGRLMRFIMHEDLFHQAADRYRARGHHPAGVPDIDRAEDFMVCSWFGRNGVAGTESYNQGFCVRYTKNGGHAATRWRSTVESIPAWHERLRGVTILNRCAFQLLSRIDDATGTAIYCDPPYITKGATYIHDFGKKPCADCERIHTHAELAELMQRFKKARVVVSYYEHPDLERLYAGWEKVDCTMTKALVNQGMRDERGKAAQAPEVLLVNGESVTAERGLFA